MDLVAGMTTIAVFCHKGGHSANNCEKKDKDKEKGKKDN